MIDFNDIKKLMDSFPRSIITQNGHFVAHTKANEMFNLSNCETLLDIKCKVLEWLSRAAFKSEPFREKKSNEDLHKFMLDGINRYLQTNFTPNDMCEIYIYIGNAINHNKTIRFIESNYNLRILKEDKQ